MTDSQNYIQNKERNYKKYKKIALTIKIPNQTDVPVNTTNNYEKDLSSNEYKKDTQFTNEKTPLSGLKLIRSRDGSSPYLNCTKFFSQSSPTGLIPNLDQKDQNNDEQIPKILKYKMASLLQDENVWPLVYLCFGRGCKVQVILYIYNKFVKETFCGSSIPLSDSYLVDNDPYLKEFKRIFDQESKLLVVDINRESNTTGFIKVCSTIYADRHAGHLLVSFPINHPFFVEGKGWCQLESKNKFFNKLSKMDILSILPDDKYFNFDYQNKINENNDERSQYSDKNKSISTRRFKYHDNYNTNPMMYHNYDIYPGSDIRKYGYCSRSYKICENRCNLPCCNQYRYSHEHSYDYLNLSNNYDTSSSNQMSAGCPQNHDLNTSIISNNNSVNYQNSNHSPYKSIENSKSSEQEQSNYKRPMNGFMLFARQMRMKLINENPGKDNRVISQILGEKWKSLNEDERKIYIDEAKLISEKRMKVNPLCWKRKNNYKKKNNNDKFFTENDKLQINLEDDHNSNSINYHNNTFYNEDVSYFPKFTH